MFLFLVVCTSSSAAEILITIRQGLICFPPVKKSNNYIIPSYIQWTLKNAKENWRKKKIADNWDPTPLVPNTMRWVKSKMDFSFRKRRISLTIVDVYKR